MVKVTSIKPKNILRKKFFLILKLISFPNPDIDTDTKVIPTIKISI